MLTLIFIIIQMYFFTKLSLGYEKVLLMAQNRVFRVIKSGFLDYLKKILPYTFDFFGLAELQIMPKDAQA